VFPAAVGVVLIAGLAIAPFTALRGRLTLSTTDRARVWTQTLESATDPWFGSGPGTYLLRGSVDGLPTRTTFAHNEYLQTYVETGAVGLASVVVAIALISSVVWRARRRDPVWAAAAGALTAFAVHSGFDFLWRIPALTGIAFALIALAAAPPEPVVSAQADGDAQPVTDGHDR
jgi:O-antigen ligase